MEDDIFGKSLIWNKEETKFVYVAKRKPPKEKHFYEIDFNSDEQFKMASNYKKYA